MHVFLPQYGVESFKPRDLDILSLNPPVAYQNTGGKQLKVVSLLIYFDKMLRKNMELCNKLDICWELLHLQQFLNAKIYMLYLFIFFFWLPSVAAAAYTGAPLVGK